MNLSLIPVQDSLPEISATRKYWFVRTQQGTYYQDFIDGGYIAIGYNKITLEMIKSAYDQGELAPAVLSDIVSRHYTKEEEYRPGHAASQLLRFAYEIKKGDIILIPSENSTEITFGEVLNNANYTVPTTNTGYYKRKKVRWSRSIKRDDLDPNLYRLMFSHHTISDANSYAVYIDKILNTFFIKNGKANLVLNVEQVDDIKAKDLFQMGSISLDLLDDFCQEYDMTVNSDDITLKLDVQSPGFILLSGSNIAAIIILGIIIVAISGGGFTFSDASSKVKASIKTDGIIEKVRKFLNSNSNRSAKKKILKDHIDELKIQNPDDLVKILRELDK